MRVSCMFPPKPSLWVARGLFIPSKVPCYRLARTVTFGYVCGFNFDIRARSRRRHSHSVLQRLSPLTHLPTNMCLALCAVCAVLLPPMPMQPALAASRPVFLRRSRFRLHRTPLDVTTLLVNDRFQATPRLPAWVHRIEPPLEKRVLVSARRLVFITTP